MMVKGAVFTPRPLPLRAFYAVQYERAPLPLAFLLARHLGS